MMKEVGYVIIWRDTNKQEHSEYIHINQADELVAKYEEALTMCGEEHIYIYPVSDILSMWQTRNLIVELKNNTAGVEA
jgi:hypothetical protein